MREDYNIDFDGLKWAGDEWFFPAIQDAEMHDQEMFAKGRSYYLPFGVDTEIFKPYSHAQLEGLPLRQNYLDAVLPQTHTIDVGFLGLLYQKRQLFLQALNRHQHPPIQCSMCAIQDIRGYDQEGSMRLLASNTREIKVFLNLPSLSRLLVSKVTEVMACGTFLLTPKLPEQSAANMDLFKDGTHLVYYSASNVGYVAQLLREWVSPDKDAERRTISEAGCREVHEKHSLKIRLEEMLAKLKVGVSVND
jgi:spore maturation protein CgeB